MGFFSQRFRKLRHGYCLQMLSDAYSQGLEVTIVHSQTTEKPENMLNTRKEKAPVSVPKGFFLCVFS